MSDTKNVLFLDLVTHHAELEAELTSVFQEALRTAGFIGGPMVEKFEREFAAFCDAKYCAGVNSGTDALRFALTAAGIGKGHAVVTVPNTFIATTEAISQAGASPVFVDVDERTYNMDVIKLREYLERCETNQDGSIRDSRTHSVVKAIVPVHLYGQMADMDPILELAQRYNLVVIEDACQAHGAEYFSQKENCWKKAGSMGHAAAFSFYPGKNLGACGEAGAVTTNNEKMVATVKMIRDHGQSRKYYHDIEGYNGRLDSIQAGILSVKLRHLADWNTKRRANAIKYRELFGTTSSPNLVLPYELPGTRPVYHLFVIRTTDREGLKTSLANAGVGTGIHYPVPLHLQAAYQTAGYKHGDYPITEKVAAEILSLPMYPGLTQDECLLVVASVIEELGLRRSSQSVGVEAREQVV